MGNSNKPSYSTFHEIKLCAIKPRHWLKEFLIKQRDGLTGHLEVAGFPFDSPGWMTPDLKPGPDNKAWWHYEQYAYWIDGMIRCGHLLSDPMLTQKALRQIDYVLDHPDSDAYLGPPVLKGEDNYARWPHVVFFRALMAHHSATGEKRIPQAVSNHYTGCPHPHSKERDVCNIEPMLWAYGQTGDQRLLKQAERAFQTYNTCSSEDDTSLTNLLSNKRATEHGVTYNEIAKLGAILYCYAGEQQYLDASINAYRKLDRDQILVDGVCSSAEALQGKDSLDSHETCDIADYTWSVGYLLLATGDAAYADKIERACFNAAPGAVRADFKGLQYFSCPNQVIADYQSNHNYFYRGDKRMSYRPMPGTQCCSSNVSRIMPNYVSRMWMSDGEDGIVAAFYGPSELTTHLGPEGHPIKIIEDTTYPFSEQVDFYFETERPLEFTFSFRIPAWCSQPQAILNGDSLNLNLQSGQFIRLRRTFSDGDQLSLHLPQDIHIQRWPKGGISIERGPLVYALRIKEDWQIDANDPNSTPEFPAWNLHAGSPWNYALAIGDLKNPAQDIEIVKNEAPPSPWNHANAPVLLQVPARRVKGWKLNKKQAIKRWGPTGNETVKGSYIFTPSLPSPQEVEEGLQDEVETITLVPYGCTRLRMTIFPCAK